MTQVGIRPPSPQPAAALQLLRALPLRDLPRTHIPFLRGVHAPVKPPLLRAVLTVFGLVFIFGIFLLTRIWPSGWAWQPEQVSDGRGQIMNLCMEPPRA